MKKCTVILAFLIVVTVVFSSCTDSKNDLNIGSPEKIATGDEIYPAQNTSAVEESLNVNGMRFTSNLIEFTNKYNKLLSQTGDSEILYTNSWKKEGETKQDTKGVKYDNYYYDCNKITFTASVETESDKIINIGCATTMSNFVKQENSDEILKKTSLMALAVCGFPDNSLDVIQNIFYSTTFENCESMWYQGFIFSLSTKEDTSNNENSIMLFRVFPVKEELKNDWNIVDYEEYISSAPVEASSANIDSKTEG